MKPPLDFNKPLTMEEVRAWTRAAHHEAVEQAKRGCVVLPFRRPQEPRND